MLYERAEMRWLGRFCLEAGGATLEDGYQVAEALERLPDHHEQVAAARRARWRHVPFAPRLG